MSNTHRYYEHCLNVQRRAVGELILTQDVRASDLIANIQPAVGIPATAAAKERDNLPSLPTRQLRENVNSQMWRLGDRAKNLHRCVKSNETSDAAAPAKPMSSQL